MSRSFSASGLRPDHGDGQAAIACCVDGFGCAAVAAGGAAVPDGDTVSTLSNRCSLAAMYASRFDVSKGMVCTVFGLAEQFVELRGVVRFDFALPVVGRGQDHLDRAAEFEHDAAKTWSAPRPRQVTPISPSRPWPASATRMPSATAGTDSAVRFECPVIPIRDNGVGLPLVSQRRSAHRWLRRPITHRRHLKAALRPHGWLSGLQSPRTGHELVQTGHSVPPASL